MNHLAQKLEAVFQAFIHHRVSNEALIELKNDIHHQDVAVLFEHVENMGEPQDYCKNDYDQKTVEGFFLYIDFISALLIHLEQVDLSQYQHLKSDYVKWILRYVDEPRFHQEIKAKFENIFEKDANISR